MFAARTDSCMFLFSFVVVELSVGNISINLFCHRREILEGCRWSGRSIVEPTSSINTTRFMRPSGQVPTARTCCRSTDMHFLCGVHIFASTSFQGGFAKVKLGRHILTGEKVAIKIMNKKDLGVSFVDAGWG